MKTAILVATLALAGSALPLTAQDGPPPGDRPPRRELGGPGRPGPDNGPGPEGRRMFVPPLFAALDANRDGVIDEQEIAQASESLKKLDKNGDGKITLEEVRPPRPEGARGPGRPGRPDGDRPGFRGPPPGRPDGNRDDGPPPHPQRPPEEQ